MTRQGKRIFIGKAHVTEIWLEIKSSNFFKFNIQIQPFNTNNISYIVYFSKCFEYVLATTPPPEKNMFVDLSLCLFEFINKVRLYNLRKNLSTTQAINLSIKLPGVMKV